MPLTFNNRTAPLPKGAPATLQLLCLQGVTLLICPRIGTLAWAMTTFKPGRKPGQKIDSNIILEFTNHLNLFSSQICYKPAHQIKYVMPATNANFAVVA